MFNVTGFEGRVDVGTGGGFLKLDSRVGDVGRLILDGGTGGGVLDFPIPVLWVDTGCAGEVGESILKDGVIRGANPIDCGRCRGAGRVAGGAGGARCDIEFWVSCSHWVILLPELKLASWPAVSRVSREGRS